MRSACKYPQPCLISCPASYTDLYIVHHGLPPDDGPVRSARVTSFARCLLLILAITIMTTSLLSRTQTTDLIQPLHPFSLPESTKMISLMTNRTWVFFLVTRVPLHSPVGETSPRSASLPSAATQSGIKPMRTGTANNTLNFFYLSFPPPFVFLAQPTTGHRFDSLAHAVLAIVLIPL